LIDDFPLYDKVSLALILADHTDKLAGNLGIGNVPSGSSDPIGLRRSAQVMVKIGASLPEFDTFPLKPGFNLALELYGQQGIDLNKEEALVAFRKLISSRYEATILAGARPDLIAAAVFEADPDAPLDPSAVQLRYQFISEIGSDASLIQTLTRPLNILKAARQKNETIPDDLCGEELREPTEQALYAQLIAGASLLPPQRARALKAPIDQFFDTVMVMDEDPKVRANRLALLAKVEAQIAELGDVTKIVLADKP
jgi:glycyl-tRNA synthetase beta chain